MQWKRELDGGRKQELEASGRAWLKVGDKKTCMEKMVNTSVWLVRICERYGGRPDKRPQNPTPGSSKGGLGDSQEAWCVGKLCFRLGPAGWSGGQLDELHYRHGIWWRGQNVGK